jgi:hypothetical protein
MIDIKNKEIEINIDKEYLFNYWGWYKYGEGFHTGICIHYGWGDGDSYGFSNGMEEE